ncbi:transcription elongation factor GreA [Telmatocola sphagniphila]|uniref:Transcription elongation factor GreA n=1 Tax=Telmatocola sphagniphila TaxID=1123043 RepID=A0A8E6B9J8_9BACT|nr:transcription elongation factor GreA [Telmatocola sphagniphila]QVL33651.1 transcription elongation factor GreA [Telmatocola sphagniphila]
MADERIPMTREGYDKLKSELDHLVGVEMIEITKKLAEARSEGDLSENAEYHAQRENQGQLQAKINEIRDKLSRASIVEPGQRPKDIVTFGATVKVKDVDIDEEETFTIVGPGDDDPDQNKILSTSPIGQGLLGKKKGETAEIPVPRGKLKFKILAISYE